MHEGNFKINSGGLYQKKPRGQIEKKTPEPLFEKTLGFFHKFIHNLPTTYPEPLIESSFINYSEYTHLYALWVYFNKLSINSQFWSVLP